MLQSLNIFQPTFSLNDAPGVSTENRSAANNPSQESFPQVGEGTVPELARIDTPSQNATEIPYGDVEVDLGELNNPQQANTTDARPSLARTSVKRLLKNLTKLSPILFGAAAANLVAIAVIDGKQKIDSTLKAVEDALSSSIQEQEKTIMMMENQTQAFNEINNEIFEANERTNEMVKDIFLQVADISSQIEGLKNQEQFMQHEVKSVTVNTAMLNDIMQEQSDMIAEINEVLASIKSQGLN